jgi:hypothetical protein
MVLHKYEYQQCRLRAENKIVSLPVQVPATDYKLHCSQPPPPFFRCEWVCLIIRNINNTRYILHLNTTFLNRKIDGCAMYAVAVYLLLLSNKLTSSILWIPNTGVLAVCPGFILGAYITQIGIYLFPTCIVWNPLVLYGEGTAKGTIFSLHATKASRGQRHIVPVILNLSTS